MNHANVLRTAVRAARQTQYATSRRLHTVNAQPLRQLARPAPPSFLRKPFANTRIANQLRWESTTRPPNPLTDRSSELETKHADEIAARKAQEPAYEMHFTCKKCQHRSSHRITKQAYHHGTTLVTCPGCKNRHLISDHLRIFSDKSVTLEDIMKEKGQFLRKGRVGEDGDIEFYDEVGPGATEEGVGKER